MYKTQFSKSHEQSFEKVSKLPSLTVPDQSLTISQVLTKFASGTLPNISKQPQYDYDETSDKKLDNMDNISPFRTQNYDLADYTIDSINNRNSSIHNTARKSDLEKQIIIQTALDETEKAKNSTPTVNDKVD